MPVPLDDKKDHIEIITPGDEPAGDKPVVVAFDRSATSTWTIFRIVAVTLVLLFVGGFLASMLSSLTHLLFIVVLAVLFAYLIEPLVRLIRRPFRGTAGEKVVTRPAAILLAFALVFSALGIGIYSIAPVVAEQGKEFGANLPEYFNNIRQSVNDLNRRFDRLRLPNDVQAQINDQAGSLGGRITAGFGSFLLTLVSYLPWLALIPILAFFFLKDANIVRLTILRIFPAGPWRVRAEAVLQDVNATLAAYTRAQLLSCLLIGTICTIGFYLIGIKFALLFGILAGIFEFVPVIGPATIGLIVVVAASFSDQPVKGLYAFAFLLGLRMIHDYFTYPRIVREGLHMHPILIILSILAGEQIAGIPGVFLAIPIVAVVTVFYRHIIEHKGGKGLVAGLIGSEKAPAEEGS